MRKCNRKITGQLHANKKLKKNNAVSLSAFPFRRFVNKLNSVVTASPNQTPIACQLSNRLTF